MHGSDTGDARNVDHPFSGNAAGQLESNRMYLKLCGGDAHRATCWPAVFRTAYGLQMQKLTAIAIPVRDEEHRIGRCLAALSKQTVRADHLVLVLNDCTDGTAAVVRASVPAAHQVHVIETCLHGTCGGAGGARRVAMNHASGLLRDGVILTTDADAVTAPDWIERNLEAIEAGADAVCGMAVIDPVEALAIPAHLHDDDAREVAYVQLLNEMQSLILPDDADPWPRHAEDSGASIAVTTRLLRRVGGVPCCSVGEDRALIAALRRIGARVRHDPAIRVVVSGRLEGRAEGGMADTMRRRMVAQDEYTDERLEPAMGAFRRLLLKRHFQIGRQHPNELDMLRLATRLSVTQDVLSAALGAPLLEEGWREVERRSSALRRYRVAFRDLPGQARIAQRILSRVRDARLNLAHAEVAMKKKSSEMEDASAYASAS